MSDKLLEDYAKTITAALDAVDELQLFVESYGIVLGGGQTRLVETLRRYPDSRLGKISEAEFTEQLARAKKMEAFVKDHGQSYLFGFCAVQFWSILEATTDTLLRSYLDDRSRWGENDFLRSIKGPLVEFVQLDHENQLDALVEHVKIQLRAGQQSGVGRFESILDKIGLGGAVADEVKTVLFELGQVRNVIAHRRGIVDGRLLRQCPWLEFTSNDRLRLTGWHLVRYHSASHWYMVEVVNRTIQDPAKETPVPNDRALNDLRRYGVKTPPKSETTATTEALRSQ